MTPGERSSEPMVEMRRALVVTATVTGRVEVSWGR
jgi:hypothetical protein